MYNRHPIATLIKKTLLRIVVEFTSVAPISRLQFGGWGALAVAAVGAYSASQASSSASDLANKALNQQGFLANEQGNNSAQESNFAGQLQQQYQQLYAPLESQYVQQMRAPVDANVYAGQAAGDVQSAAQSNEAALRRQSAAYGINPESGASQALEQQAGLQTSAAMAGAATSARRYAQNLQLQRMGAALQTGNALTGSATQLYNSSNSALTGAANTYGQQAQIYAGAAAGAGQAEGQLLTAGINAFANNGGASTPAASTPAATTGPTFGAAPPI